MVCQLSVDKSVLTNELLPALLLGVPLELRGWQLLGLGFSLFPSSSLLFTTTL